MTDKWLLTPRDDQIRSLSEVESDFGVEVEQVIGSRLLVSELESGQIGELQTQGFRVKRLPDVNLLRIGRFVIDTSSTSETELENLDVPDGLSIPDASAQDWEHHLIQFVAPPEPDWINAVESQGLEVVDQLPPYGVFVVGDAATAQAAESLPFIAWVGPFKPAYRISATLAEQTGLIENVSISVIGDSLDPVRALIDAADGQVVSAESTEERPLDSYRTLFATVQASVIPELARLPEVRWLDYAPPYELEDERSCQIVLEDLNGVAAPNTGPNTGYQDQLFELDIDGSGVIIGVCDTGIDSHNNATMHPDLAGRLAFFADQTGGAVTDDQNGHGTHVAGIALGNAASGDTDPQGFLLGQGVAPGAQFGSVNAIGTGAGITVATMMQLMSTNGANVTNNSWGGGSGGTGYSARARTTDQLVRDPNTSSADLEQLAIVFSAGNSGGRLTSVTDPKEAKNLIVVGNSLNFRPGELFPTDDIRGISGSSSRGPAVDGRILPTVVAPGTNIIAVRSNADTSPAPGVQPPQAGVHRHGRHDSQSTSSPHRHFYGGPSCIRPVCASYRVVAQPHRWTNAQPRYAESIAHKWG